MTKSIVIAIASAAAIITFAPKAFAANLTFSYEVSSVASDQGAARVAKRLQRSVENACKSSGLKSISTLASERRCETELMSDMINKIEDVRLTNALVGNVRIAQN